MLRSEIGDVKRRVLSRLLYPQVAGEKIVAKKKVLFISGSIGLGHVNRDLTIAHELSLRWPGIEISWLAAEPAKSVIKEAGGEVEPEVEGYGNDTAVAQQTSNGTEINLYKYVTKAMKPSGEWAKNIEVLKKIIQRGDIDLVIGDETYEILIAILQNKLKLNIPFVIIYDFLGLDAMTRNPIELISVYMINRMWSQDFKIIERGNNLALFIGELDDVMNKTFGPFLPNRRVHASNYYKFLGYILPFKPSDYYNKGQIRRRLGYGEETLLICSIGGTGIGKELLEICGKAYQILKESILNLRMIIVGGPGLELNKLAVPPDVELRQYVPALYEHFAACDMAIVQAGGTTTLELTALGRPFIYIPQEKKCEQNLTVCVRLERHRSGIRMNYKDVTPESLADMVLANIGKPIDYSTISTDGAERAAELIGQKLY
jgi:UDP-N-acetylglucosamine:LPS N-acetylglucosamine transferase